MWVFGYGSLIWNPGFEYQDSKVGFIKGYVRRFWQGNDFHRGNPEKLGRVATLVEEEEGVTWGRAFLLGPSASSSLSYLDSRETQLGGYNTRVVSFHPRDTSSDSFPALLYVAMPSNRLYMGAASLEQVAADIAGTSGHCGHNAEYLLRLAEFLRAECLWDEHLHGLEKLVRTRLAEMGLRAEDMMGNIIQGNEAKVASGSLENDQERALFRSASPDFVSRVPDRKVRCLDI